MLDYLSFSIAKNPERSSLIARSLLVNPYFLLLLILDRDWF